MLSLVFDLSTGSTDCDSIVVCSTGTEYFNEERHGRTDPKVSVSAPYLPMAPHSVTRSRPLAKRDRFGTPPILVSPFSQTSVLFSPLTSHTFQGINTAMEYEAQSSFTIGTTLIKECTMVCTVSFFHLAETYLIALLSEDNGMYKT